jgi:hypothetical protein
MQLTANAPQLALDSGQVVTLDDAAGTRIHARIGTVWVTEEGSVKDHILGPGEAFTVAHDGRTVVQAMKPAWIAFGEGEPAANDASISEEFDLGVFLRRVAGRYY